MTNLQYKQAALATLKGKWLTALSISIVYFLIFALAASRMSFDQDNLDSMLRFVALNIVVTIVLAPVTVGRTISYLRLVRGETAGIGTLFEGFSSIRFYLKVMAAYTVVTLLVYLGSFLIVPAIYFYLMYRLVPFLLIDRPDLSFFQVLGESRRMMHGHKWRLVKLYLSFIIWGILALLSTVGVVLLTPYFDTTMAHFYEQLKKEQQPATRSA
ncbi:DUF975 family protein [Exiguobacterium artemiae]|uniref:DUF975 family protein n=1 Tax=Exiguobacterium sp. S22-S28 TaxID=3342768 RepID=UPI0011CB8044